MTKMLAAASSLSVFLLLSVVAETIAATGDAGLSVPSAKRRSVEMQQCLSNHYWYIPKAQQGRLAVPLQKDCDESTRSTLQFKSLTVKDVHIQLKKTGSEIGKFFEITVIDPKFDKVCVLRLTNHMQLKYIADGGTLTDITEFEKPITCSSRVKIELRDHVLTSERNIGKGSKATSLSILYARDNGHFKHIVHGTIVTAAKQRAMVMVVQLAGQPWQVHMSVGLNRPLHGILNNSNLVCMSTNAQANSFHLPAACDEKNESIYFGLLLDATNIVNANVLKLDDGIAIDFMFRKTGLGSSIKVFNEPSDAQSAGSFVVALRKQNGVLAQILRSTGSETAVSPLVEKLENCEITFTRRSTTDTYLLDFDWTISVTTTHHKVPVKLFEAFVTFPSSEKGNSNYTKVTIDFTLSAGRQQAVLFVGQSPPPRNKKDEAQPA